MIGGERESSLRLPSSEVGVWAVGVPLKVLELGFGNIFSFYGKGDPIVTQRNEVSRIGAITNRFNGGYG